MWHTGIMGAMAYVVRLLDGVIPGLLSEVSALFIAGPRATGKTTTAMRYARTVVRLDREAEAVAFRADPDAALRGLREPILLDEWQLVPDILGAVKRAVDRDPGPGRYVITGSVRSEVSGTLWPGTGRLVRLTMHGLTVRERLGRTSQRSFLDRVTNGHALDPAPATPDLRGYVELALRSGFPDAALRLGEISRRRWLESYVEHLLARDVSQLDPGRDPARLRRYFEALALNTAGVVDDTTLYQAAGIDRRTAISYERLLEDLLAIERVPAWSSNRLKRLVLSPKRYLTDPALAGAILGMDTNAIIRDGNMLGRILDSFVAAQLRPEIAVAGGRPRLHHLRQQQGRLEVDLLLERSREQVVGVEVKADAAPRRDSARHLLRLRDSLGAAFLAGVVLHTGPRAYALDDRITAAPISALWA
ncbi:ATP-binding protein [soil metagenome]